MSQLIEQFKQSWKFVRSMTFDFIEVVPEDRWDFTPHPKFAPFSKQVRHLICVQGVYNDGLVTGKVDFSKKHHYYVGELDRKSLIDALHKQDGCLFQILERFADKNLQSVCIDFCGIHMGFAEYAFNYIQHESIHHGQWSMYAALGGFETPIRWKKNWKL
jgi:hypothetical protein